MPEKDWTSIVNQMAQARAHYEARHLLENDSVHPMDLTPNQLLDQLNEPHRLVILVHKNSPTQFLAVWENNRRIYLNPKEAAGKERVQVSTGYQYHVTKCTIRGDCYDTESPMGAFVVRATYPYKDSTDYSSPSGIPIRMDWAINVVGGYYLHAPAANSDGSRPGTADLGSPASHGCIRVRLDNIHRLNQIVTAHRAEYGPDSAIVIIE